jgi:urease accessory protein
MPLIANPWLYGVGFVTGTALIHLTGVLVGFAFRSARRGDYAIRAAGAGIAAAGAYILFTL